MKAAFTNTWAASLHPAHSHVDRVSIGEQEGLTISQGSDSWNGPPATLSFSLSQGPSN